MGAGTETLNTLADYLVAGRDSRIREAYRSYLEAGKTAEEAKQLICAAETQKILRGFLAGATLAGTANLLGRVLSKGKTGKTEIDKPEGNGRVKGGSKAIDNAIPNVESATINPRKLTEYALNPNHPVGGNKAKVFESALGYNQSNADDLIRQIYEKLPSSEAVVGKLDQYGQRYTVDIPIIGPNGNIVNVRTGWITKTGSDIPELTTIYVKD